jgi:hypothetical protein
MDAGARLTVDHYQPESQGGQDEPGNWVYCCHACNEFKSDYWHSESALRILHPMRDNLTDHLAEQPDGTLQALTETGEFHIQKLSLNRPALVAHRRERQLAVQSHLLQSRLARRLEEIEYQLLDLAAKINRLAPGDEPS